MFVPLTIQVRRLRKKSISPPSRDFASLNLHLGHIAVPSTLATLSEAVKLDFQRKASSQVAEKFLAWAAQHLVVANGPH
jgi:hypothetical protein